MGKLTTVLCSVCLRRRANVPLDQLQDDPDLGPGHHPQQSPRPRTKHECLALVPELALHHVGQAYTRSTRGEAPRPVRPLAPSGLLTPGNWAHDICLPHLVQSPSAWRPLPFPPPLSKHVCVGASVVGHSRLPSSSQCCCSPSPDCVCHVSSERSRACLIIVSLFRLRTWQGHIRISAVTTAGCGPPLIAAPG